MGEPLGSGASNFYELAVATAIVLFGVNSGAALVTVVDVLYRVQNENQTFVLQALPSTNESRTRREHISLRLSFCFEYSKCSKYS